MPRAGYQRQIGSVGIITSRYRLALETNSYTNIWGREALTLILIFLCRFRNGRLLYQFYRYLELLHYDWLRDVTRY